MGGKGIRTFSWKGYRPTGGMVVLVLQMVFFLLCSGPVWAGPQGGTVAGGAITINQNGGRTSISQSSQKGIVNWQDFSISANESVIFSQPNSAAITLNRVLGSNISTIDGLLQANGTLFIINGNGIVFGQGATVNVAGLVASTFDLSDDDFLAGRYNFALPGLPGATIANHGQITIAQSGLAAFVAPHVVNNGMISARLGRVALGATQDGFSLDFYGDNLIRFRAPDSLVERLASQNVSVAVGGTLAADGGQILISADTARDVVSSIVTVGGEVRADTVAMAQGRIVLSGAQVDLYGQIQARSETGQGGSISISTDTFAGMAGGRLNTDGVTGGTIHLEASGMAAFSSELSAKGVDTGGVIEVTGDSVILLNGDVDVSGGRQGGTVHLGGEWQGGGELSQARETIIGTGSEVLANGTETGGEIVVWSTDSTEHYGLLQANDGGRIELSSKGHLQLNGELEAGAGGEVLLDPKNLVIVDTVPDSLTMALKVASGSGATGMPTLINGDWFGRAVAIDGDRLAIGAELDDSGGTDYGAVHLFTGMDGFTSGGLTWRKKLYSANGAIDMVATPGADHFGVSVALDGDLLAVGAHLDDRGSGSNAGAVYLFNGVGSNFSSLTYQTEIFDNEYGLTLRDEDRFGVSVAIDAASQRLVVGAHQTGDRPLFFIGSTTYEGAVHYFTWTGANYSGLVHDGVLGYGGSGPNLTDGDHFGISVALDGDRLAVGARGDSSNTGAVYLFNNLDAGFGAIVNLGQLDTTALGLSAGDEFGFATALENDKLVVSAYLDDTGGTNRGAVYLYSGVGSDFTGLTLEKKLADGSSGLALADNDNFGSAVALDGDRLAVGAFLDDTDGADRGAVYLFSGMDSVGGIAAGDARFAYDPSADSFITPTSITALLNAGTAVTLQANNDITLTNPIVTGAGGFGGDLLLQAGRSVLLNADITTDNGNLTITANETAANGVVDGDRDAGDAAITMASGTTIDAGTGSLVATLSTGAGNSNTGSADITLQTIIADTVVVSNYGPSTGGVVTSGVITAANAGDGIVLRTGGLYNNNVGAGVFNLTGGGRYLVFAPNLAAITANGLSATPWYNTAVTAPTTGIGTGNRFVSAEVATLTVTADNQTRLYGAANPVFGQTVSGYINGETTAILTGLAGDGSSTAGATTNVGSVVISGSVGTLGTDRNYAITSVDGTLTITPAPLTVTATNQTKIYGTSLNLGTTAFSSTGLQNSETIGGVTLTSNGGYATNTSASVATYAADIDANGASGGTFSASNYAITYVAADLSVTPLAITITASDQSKIYGSTVSLGSSAFTSTPLANSETIGAVTLTSTGGYDSAVGAGVATYAGDLIASAPTGGSFDPANYAISYVPGDFTINQASLNISAVNDGKTYDGLAYSGGGGVVYSGFVAGDTSADLGGSLSYTGTSQGASDAGGYVLTPTGQTSANYAITFVDGSLTISPAPLTVTANADSKVYDGLAYSGGGGVVYSGFVAGETSADLGGTLGYTGTAQGAVTVGNTLITPMGFTSGNYSISFVDGTLTITPAPLTVTATNQTKIYGTSLNLGTTAFSSTGLQNSETIGGVTLTSNGGYATNTSASVATYAADIDVNGASGGTFNASNYAITYVAADLSVTPRAITVTASDRNKIYGSTLALGNTEFTVSNMANSETIGTVLLASAGNIASDASANAGLYVNDIIASNAGGGTYSPANYTISYAAGDLRVNQAPLIVAANNESKTYDGLAYSGGNGVTYTGFVNGETDGDLGGLLVYGGSSQGAVNAGGYSIIPSGLSSGNYSISFINSNLNVAPRFIAFTANPATKEELTLDPPLSLSLTGGSLAPTDALVEVTGQVGRELGERPGLYNILLGTGSKAGNYAVSFVANNKSFTIMPTADGRELDQNWDTTIPVDIIPPEEDIEEILPDFGEPVVVDLVDPGALLPQNSEVAIPDVGVPEPPVVVVEAPPVQEVPVQEVTPAQEPVTATPAPVVEPPVVEPVALPSPPVPMVKPIAIPRSEAASISLSFEPDGTVTLNVSAEEPVVGITMMDTSISRQDQTLFITRYRPAKGQSVRFATMVSVVFLGESGPIPKGGYIIADDGDGLAVFPFAGGETQNLIPSQVGKKISFSLTDRKNDKITYNVFVGAEDLRITPESRRAALLALASPELVLALAMVEVQKQLDISLDDIKAVFFDVHVY